MACQNIGRGILIFSFLFFFFSISSAQEIVPKQESAEIIKGKSRTLVQPVYPNDARAARVSGSVEVKVLIDEEGNVVSAKAVSGHFLLREVSEKAALESKFLPTYKDGVAVKVSGTIVYNFVPQNPPSNLPPPPPTGNWLQLGFQLGRIETSESIDPDFSAAQYLNLIPQDQAEERNRIGQLDLEKEKIVEARKVALAEERKNRELTNRTFVMRPKKAISTNHNEIASSLIATIKNRLAQDILSKWYFKVGTILGDIWQQTDNTERVKQNLETLKTLQAEKPKNVSPHISSILQEIQNKANADALPEYSEKEKAELIRLINLSQKIEILH
jgi:hypothetical protein